MAVACLLALLAVMGAAPAQAVSSRTTAPRLVPRSDAGATARATTKGAPQPGPSRFHAVTPVRVLDSRPASQVGPYGTPWPSHGTRRVTVAGLDGVPADATAVALNVTAARTTATSFLTIWPAGQDQPTTSDLNWVPGQVVANTATVEIGSADQVVVYNLAGAADVVIDITGYYDGLANGGGYQPVGLMRALDSRPASQVGPYDTPWSSGTARTVQVGDEDPAATAVVVNLTVTDTTSPSYLTAWAAGQPRPTASSLNWAAGQIVANTVTVAVGQDGSIDLYNLAGTADVVVDIVGFYVEGSGASFHPLTPTRILDSRAGSQVGPYDTPWSNLAGRPVSVAGVANVPANAVAVSTNLTVADGTAQSWLRVYSVGPVAAEGSLLAWMPGQVVANQVIVPVGTGGQAEVLNFQGTVEVIMDVTGYFR